jgi:hypothetical protein
VGHRPGGSGLGRGLRGAGEDHAEPHPRGHRGLGALPHRREARGPGNHAAGRQARHGDPRHRPRRLLRAPESEERGRAGNARVELRPDGRRGSAPARRDPRQPGELEKLSRASRSRWRARTHALAESEAKYRILVDSSPLGIVIVQGAGGVRQPRLRADDWPEGGRSDRTRIRRALRVPVRFARDARRRARGHEAKPPSASRRSSPAPTGSASTSRSKRRR